MGNGFAGKLALSNIKKNRKFYLPYILASVGIIMMFYIMAFLSFNPGRAHMAGADALGLIMALGCVVLGLFSLIFIFYINSFLMKKRQKEIGLYNILGMEKKHIAKILFIENFITSAGSIVAGLLCGVLFSKLVFMIICKAMQIKTPIEFFISVKGLLLTAAVFGVIFLLTLLKNQMSVGLAKPIELLRGGETGEREPRSKGVLAIIGAICLGIGYYIAITTDNPLQAIMLFFVAVLLVIVGTYLLFIAGSIAILKALRRNKKFYYKANHFTAVSGMLYRMKQNAVGLANICILSTMVLVMISTTVCLRVGIDDLIDNSCPGDITIRSGITVSDIDNTGKIYGSMTDASSKVGVKLDKVDTYLNYSHTFIEDGDSYQGSEENVDSSTQFSIVTAGEYERLTGNNVKLANNQVLSAGAEIGDNFKLGDKTFTVKKTVDKFLPGNDEYDGYYKCHYLVVSNMNVLKDIISDVEKNMGDESGSSVLGYHMVIYSNASSEKLNAMCVEFDHANLDFMSYNQIITRAETEEAYYGFSGGFLFLGIFLGLVFTFAAALIIYYKQISEGYYDKDKFQIMQKVGMSKEEVKKSIKTQVLMVFFAPLAMAAIHVLAAFNLIKELLKLFTLYNVGLFAVCTVVTFVVFAIIYSMVYGVTAKEYYKIVEE